MSEIERRFLVTDTEHAPMNRVVRILRIEQGYLAIDEDTKSSVRIRCTVAGYELTAKAGVGLERFEEPLPLSNDDGKRFWPLTQGSRVLKVRHIIPATDDADDTGLKYELDIFEGRHDGLWMVEVEFASKDLAAVFVPPGWFGREVTDDPRYTNAWLARYGIPQEDRRMIPW